MGTFNYTVDINKNVDIDVDVDLNIDKFVSSFTNIVGYLAVAEASADAFSTGSGTPGEPCEDDFTFVIDTFDTDQTVEQTGVGTNNLPTVSGFVTSDIPGTTDRQFTVEVNTGIGTSRAESNIPNPPGSSKGRFSSDDNSSADFRVDYTTDIDGNGTPGEPDDAFSIVPIDADLTQCFLFIDDITDDLGLLPGGGNAPFTPAALEFEDADGNISQNSVELGAIVNVDIAFPLSEFNIAQGLPGGAPAVGTVLLPGVVQGVADIDVDGNGTDGVDFQNIVRISIIVDINGEAVPGTTATDISVDNFFITCPCEDQPGEGALSETETFAQVDAFSGFTEAFSSSLAATNNADFDFG
jgi:hypothetical protein